MSLPPPPTQRSPALPPPPPAAPRRHGLLAVAILLGVVLVTTQISLLRGALPPRGPHAFLEQLSDGTPYRWNPCQPIHYVVNPDLEPDGATADIREAIRRLSAATGIRFVSDGTTVETADQQIGAAFQNDIPGPRYLPILIEFVSQEHFHFLTDTDRAIAFGLPHRGEGDQAHQYVSGAVVIDADQPLPEGFGTRYSLGPVLMHELAHVMGLGHVGAGDELMWSPQIAGHDTTPDLSLTDWGPGDLEGLRLVGRDAGCLS